MFRSSCYLSLAAMLLMAPASSAQRPKAAKAAVAKPAANPAFAAMKLEFIRIAPGEFTMGSDTGLVGEMPAHVVRMANPFELGKYEITQAQWQALMGSNPSHFAGPDRPVDNISWNDTQEFLKRLNAADPAHHYRLPTEAEWEYAARAGATGDPAGGVDELAWYFPNSNRETHPVGQKRANAWGLYDTLGNVWEWCQDWFSPDYYANSPAANPPGPETGAKKVLRGGSFGANAAYTRSSVRIAFYPFEQNFFFGLRVLREAARKN